MCFQEDFQLPFPVASCPDSSRARLQIAGFPPDPSAKGYSLWQKCHQNPFVVQQETPTNIFIPINTPPKKHRFVFEDKDGPLRWLTRHFVSCSCWLLEKRERVTRKWKAESANKEEDGQGTDTGTGDTGRAALLFLLFLCKDKDAGRGRWFANVCASFLRPACVCVVGGGHSAAASLSHHHQPSIVAIHLSTHWPPLTDSSVLVRTRRSSFDRDMFLPIYICEGWGVPGDGVENWALTFIRGRTRSDPPYFTSCGK